MKVDELIGRLNVKLVSEGTDINKSIEGCYICDLLSWVMAHAKKDNIWITILTHINIVAVAVLTEVSCIIIPEGMKVPKETIEKANEENIPILVSDKTAFEIAKEIYKIGV